MCGDPGLVQVKRETKLKNLNQPVPSQLSEHAKTKT